ncbi:MAG: phosphomannomutase/phosphoglucomutase [Gemmatimonadetes bacterium]|nr:phosphomannomutase/phosphoglucomutase [Gemmatimonadota bacterium]
MHTAGSGRVGKTVGVNPEIFREYDVRGVVDRDLAGEVPSSIGRAFASEVRRRHGAGAPVIAVGRDNRPSSPQLAEGVIAGIMATGANVLDLGTVPTPVLYYAAERFRTAAGIQITGSHNPPEYNGFKMLVGGRALYGSAIQSLRRRIEEQDLAAGAGQRESREVLALYVDEVTRPFSLRRRVKVVADCGNGTGSLVAVQLLERIGAQVVPLYCVSDGTFPNHHPDPVVDENLRDLIRRVGEERAELGVAFDGDADRIGAVDERGAIIRGDMLLLLFGLDVLARRGPGQKLVFDVKCSQAVPEVYQRAGGEPVLWKTGHSLIKEKMKEVGAPVAGELSGHICFADEYYGFDDALYAACRLVELVARSDRPLSALLAEFPAYVSTPEIRVEVAEEQKFAIVSRAVADFRKTHEVISVDGARVLFPEGWGLLRASNTQPVLVLRYEARDRASLGRIRATFEEWLRRQGVGV